METRQLRGLAQMIYPVRWRSDKKTQQKTLSSNNENAPNVQVFNKIGPMFSNIFGKTFCLFIFANKDMKNFVFVFL